MNEAHDCALGSRDGYIYIYSYIFMSVMLLHKHRHVRVPAGMRTSLRAICGYVFLVYIYIYSLYTHSVGLLLVIMQA